MNKINIFDTTDNSYFKYELDYPVRYIKDAVKQYLKNIDISYNDEIINMIQIKPEMVKIILKNNKEEFLIFTPD